ncbi:MAG: bifunctional phosphoribosyl-AMP cyclohydrolase/phosphoribosyl-ATP diphosphatase HisIE [Campylobacterales bacterium]|nr:bifunctional phosphoribosyl-AMP cyclohydrolase/phosphoribosyl-ATP diphosphatase HisIE [Campylobacterales bacterium]
MQKIIDKIDWQKIDLLPVIVQDIQNNEVLMMAYMDKEALELSLTTKIAHYFSRSKQRIWKKGESSGHTQEIHSFYIDCDNDTLLIKVTQNGVACHTGRHSCFFTELQSGNAISEVQINSEEMYGVIDTLYHTIQERKLSDPESSWTAKLFAKGANTILKKVVEEAGEFCFAYKDNDEAEMVYEAADLTYHMLVALAAKNIAPDRVKQELSRRFNMSGIAEKSARES